MAPISSTTPNPASDLNGSTILEEVRDHANAFFDIFDVVGAPDYRRALDYIQKFKDFFITWSEAQDNHRPDPNASPEEIQKDQRRILRERKFIMAQFAVMKTAYRVCAMKAREEKEESAEAKRQNDALILQLQNLKYEEQSLMKEIDAAENYDHEYDKLPLIPVEEFLELFPDYKDKPESEIMEARIQHEYEERNKMKKLHEEKLKQKQKLNAEKKRCKERLVKMDDDLEKFIEAAAPIEAALNAE